jgi:DtxR family Mn-dependent transcriptional regulator
MEDYLEAIAKLGEGRKVVKVKQVSQMLGVKMPSVTSALKKLSEQEPVKHERYGPIQVTLDGDEGAQRMISHREALTRFFAQALGIDEETVEVDNYRIEDVISPLSMERLVKFAEFVETYSVRMANFSGIYEYYLQHGKLPQECSNRGVKKRK